MSSSNDISALVGLVSRPIVTWERVSGRFTLCSLSCACIDPSSLALSVGPGPVEAGVLSLLALFPTRSGIW